MKSSKKRTLYGELTFEILPSVYEPAEDSFLAADNLDVDAGDMVLDMGTGCGLLAVIAAQKAKRVVATDINPHAVLCTKKNAEINGVTQKINIRKGDLFKPIRKDEKFTLIIFNAPYLPVPLTEDRSWLGKTWAGGSTGRAVIDRFLTQAVNHLDRRGRILMVQSDLANVDETLKRFRKEGLGAGVVAVKKLSFETIVLIRASHLSE